MKLSVSTTFTDLGRALEEIVRNQAAAIRAMEADKPRPPAGRQAQRPRGLRSAKRRLKARGKRS